MPRPSGILIVGLGFSPSPSFGNTAACLPQLACRLPAAGEPEHRALLVAQTSVCAPSLATDHGSLPLPSALRLGFGFFAARRRREVHFPVPGRRCVRGQLLRRRPHPLPSRSEPLWEFHHVLHKPHLQEGDDFPVAAQRHFFKDIENFAEKGGIAAKVQGLRIGWVPSCPAYCAFLLLLR